MRTPAYRDIPRGAHAKHRTRSGEIHVEAASEALYHCGKACEADGVAWPKALDEIHRLLWVFLGRDEAERRRIMPPAAEEEEDEP